MADQMFENREMQNRYKESRAQKTKAAEPEESEMGGEEEQPIHEVVAEHGAAHTSHIKKHEDGHHSVTTHHEDGHKHVSHKGPDGEQHDVESAHEHSKIAMGGEAGEPAEHEMGGEQESEAVPSIPGMNS